MAQHGGFFDWFLIRDRSDPSARLRGGAAVELVAHEGRWWLYRKQAPSPTR